MNLQMPADLPICPQFVVPDEDFDQPTLEGTVEGWRAWKVATRLPKYGTPVKLQSVTHGNGILGGYWPPRKRCEAHCRYDCGAVAQRGCCCGFYSAKTLEHLMWLGYHGLHDLPNDESMFKVIGQVANWGRVTEGNQGWRSQYAYPTVLFIPTLHWTHARLLKRAYGCRVVLLDLNNVSVFEAKEQGLLEKVERALG